MIQLSGIQMKSINQTGKMAASDGEQASSFETLLQFMGQTEEEAAEVLVLVNQPLILQQNPLIDPVFKQMSLEIPPFFQEQGAPIGSQHVVNSPMTESFGKERVTTAEIKGELPLNTAALLQVTEGIGTVTEAIMKESEGLIQSSEDFSQKETQKVVHPSTSSSADFFTLVHSTPTNQPVISNEKVVPTQTVQVNQFDQEVTKFLQSSINVAGLEDGVQATFTLTPEHLGKVDVKVTIQDGQLTAEFLTSTPLGKDLLESHVQVLRSALEIQGMQVGRIDIIQQTSTNLNFMGAFSQKGDSNGRPGQQDSRKRSEPVHLQTQDEYRDYITDSGWVSQINTTV